MCIIVTTKTFVDKSKIIHFDKYDYSRVVYERAKKHVIIGCPIHGYFKQTPDKHLHGGCKKCANDALNIKTSKKCKNDFVSKAKKIHGDIYDYSKTNYINSRKKVTVECCIHGEFLVTPNNHLSKKSGCPGCHRNISKIETEFLDYIQVKIRNYSLPEYKSKHVDGYDPITNTVYEFLGDFWHGNPEKYNHLDINRVTKTPYGHLFDKTFRMFDKIKSIGYNVKYIWENDWKNWKGDVDIPIQEY